MNSILDLVLAVPGLLLAVALWRLADAVEGYLGALKARALSNPTKPIEDEGK